MTIPFRYDEDWRWVMPLAADVGGMTSPVKCTRCGHVYDLGQITDYGRYLDCMVWRCPGCRVTVDDRPVGWGDHHYVELDADGYEVRQQ